MSRLGTVGRCALVLAIFVGMAKGDEPVGAAVNPAATNAKNGRPIEVGAPRETLARTKILRVLEEPTEVDFKDLPLTDVVVFLKDRHGIEIQLDTKAMEEASIGVDTPVTRQLKDVTLRAALRMVLGALDLTYVIKDEVLLITTPDKASNELVLKIYPVGDLTTQRDGALGGEDFKPLVDAIKGSLAPTTWAEVGGPCNIMAIVRTRSLVILQTDEVHERISELLAGLRQARDIQADAPRVTVLGSLVDTLAEILSASQRAQCAIGGMGGGGGGMIGGVGMGGGEF